jgi:hypothetical protein
MVKNHLVTTDNMFFNEYVIPSYKIRMQIGDCKLKILDLDPDPH